MHTGLWWKNLKEKKPYGRPRRRQNDIKMDLSRSGMEAEIGLIWLTIQTGGGLL